MLNNGYTQFISTLTAISNRVIEQKFYEIKNLPDFVDFEPNNAGYSNELFKWVSGQVADDGETGIVGANADYERNASVDVVFEGRKYPRVQWTKKITYNYFDLQQANQAQVANLIESKETARKKNFDLMIQKLIFLGSKVNPALQGLLTNSNANVDLVTITKPISSMIVAELDALVPALLNAFKANTNNTQYFNRLVIPASDYNGLTVPYSTYNNGSKLDVIEKSIKNALVGYGVSDFKILPSVYAEASNNPLNKNIYTLYNKNIDTLSFDVGVEYQVLGTNTYDNYNFTNNAVAMFGGVNVYRPQEIMYFQF